MNGELLFYTVCRTVPGPRCGLVSQHVCTHALLSYARTATHSGAEILSAARCSRTAFLSTGNTKTLSSIRGLWDLLIHS
jgi:hypothetical protein